MMEDFKLKIDGELNSHEFITIAKGFVKKVEFENGTYSCVYSYGLGIDVMFKEKHPINLKAGDKIYVGLFKAKEVQE